MSTPWRLATIPWHLTTTQPLPQSGTKLIWCTSCTALLQSAHQRTDLVQTILQNSTLLQYALQHSRSVHVPLGMSFRVPDEPQLPNASMQSCAVPSDSSVLSRSPEQPSTASVSPPTSDHPVSPTVSPTVSSVPVCPLTSPSSTSSLLLSVAMDRIAPDLQTISVSQVVPTSTPRDLLAVHLVLLLSLVCMSELVLKY